MWNKLLAFVSFIVMPILLMVLIYTGMQAIFFWYWKPFWIALIFMIIGLISVVAITFAGD